MGTSGVPCSGKKPGEQTPSRQKCRRGMNPQSLFKLSPFLDQRSGLMKKIALAAIFLAVLFLSVSAGAIDEYTQKDIHISAQECCNASGTIIQSANSTFAPGSSITHHQFSWYSHNSTGHNQTSVAGNLTIWADMNTGTWIKVSNGTTYHDDRALVLVSDKIFNNIRIEMDKNFKNATGDTAWANMTIRYRGWSY